MTEREMTDDMDGYYTACTGDKCGIKKMCQRYITGVERIESGDCRNYGENFKETSSHLSICFYYVPCGEYHD